VRRHLVQIGLAWLAILFAWGMFIGMMGGSWVNVAIVAIIFPIVLVIVMVPHVLTWAGDILMRGLCRLRGVDPPQRYD
jgi:hypothetical protein